MDAEFRAEHRTSKVGNVNAKKHGLYSRKLLEQSGPWAGDPEYKKILKGLREEFQPKSETERQEVRELAQLYWQRRCVNRRWNLDILASPVVQDLTVGGSLAETPR